MIARLVKRSITNLKAAVMIKVTLLLWTGMKSYNHEYHEACKRPHNIIYEVYEPITFIELLATSRNDGPTVQQCSVTFSQHI